RPFALSRRENKMATANGSAAQEIPARFSKAPETARQPPTRRAIGSRTAGQERRHGDEHSSQDAGAAYHRGAAEASGGDGGAVSPAVAACVRREDPLARDAALGPGRAARPGGREERDGGCPEEAGRLWSRDGHGSVRRDWAGRRHRL